MDIETEVRDIKQYLIEILAKIDKLMNVRESIAITKLSENSLRGFLESEPDIYRLQDLKVRYK